MKITYPKLPPKFKAKWLKALRSGKYKQGKGALHRDGNFCCIGVECHLHGVSIKAMDKRPGNGGTKSSFDKIPKYMDAINGKYGNSMSLPPVQVLIEMNDGGKSFKQIANWIERNL